MLRRIKFPDTINFFKGEYYNFFVNIFERNTDENFRFAHEKKRLTMNSQLFQTTMWLLFPRELAKQKE
ncbi:hypothetical protein Avbf_16378 [Armadillidium vulgare]|nr:hypothetical protein Avbf_16378 [Armadillidium vulgare]